MKIDSINDNNIDNALLQGLRVNDDNSLLQVDDNSDNNKDKFCSLLMQMKLISHMFNHAIVGFITTILQLIDIKKPFSPIEKLEKKNKRLFNNY